MSEVRIEKLVKTCLTDKGGTANIVAGIGLTAPEKELLILVGPSDCGKSSILRVIVGLTVGSSRVDLQACKLEYSIVSPK